VGLIDAGTSRPRRSDNTDASPGGGRRDVGRLEHASGAVIHRVAAMRRDSLLIRLAGGHYPALCISPVHFANPYELRMSLLERNRHNIVGADSYTPEEPRRLKNAAFNAIRML
jgi:hypothetical protein